MNTKENVRRNPCRKIHSKIFFFAGIVPGIPPSISADIPPGTQPGIPPVIPFLAPPQIPRGIAFRMLPGISLKIYSGGSAGNSIGKLSKDSSREFTRNF